MKKKLITFGGIALIIIGAAIFLYPIVVQSKNSSENKDKIDLINDLIRANQEAGITGENSSDEAGVSSESDTSDTADTQSSVNQATNVESDTQESSDYVITAPIFDEIPAGTDAAATESQPDVIMLDGETPEEEIDPATIASRLSGQDCVGVITCDEIDLCYAIVEGVEYANIGVSIGHFEESAGIGQEGNCALAGHNGGVYGRYFGDIKKLSKGSEIKLTDLYGKEYTYNVTKSFKCEPTDIEVVGDLGEKGKFLTLVTCCENGTRRFIVRAKCTKDPVLIKQIK